MQTWTVTSNSSTGTTSYTFNTLYAISFLSPIWLPIHPRVQHPIRSTRCMLSVFCLRTGCLVLFLVQTRRQKHPSIHQLSYPNLPFLTPQRSWTHLDISQHSTLLMRNHFFTQTNCLQKAVKRRRCIYIRPSMAMLFLTQTKSCVIIFIQGVHVAHKSPNGFVTLRLWE